MLGKIVDLYSCCTNKLEILDDNLDLKFIIEEDCCQCNMCLNINCCCFP